MKGKSFRIVLIFVLLAALAVGYYYYLSTQNKNPSADSDDVEVSLVFKVTNRNLNERYPTTPREVVDFFIQIQECYYNEEYTEDEFMALITQSRMLMDEELLSSNPYNIHYENVSVDIKEKELKESKLTAYIIAKNSEIEYTLFQEQNYARVPCNYYFKDKEGSYVTAQEYILRKDAEGSWKILGADLITEDE